MRIALITDGIWPYVLGGMQKHSYFLCRYLARNKVHVHLFHYNNSAYDIHKLEFFTEQEREYIRPVIVDLPQTGRFPGHYLYRSWRHSKKMYELVLPTIDSYDLIYTKGFTGWHLIDRKFRGHVTCGPVGVNFHGYEMFQRAPDLRSLVQQWILLRMPVKKISRRADLVFSYGGKITGIILSLGVPQERIVEMPAAVEENSWVTRAEGTRTPLAFVFVGRYERRKGIEELNEAITEMEATPDKKFVVHFIGPIPENKKIRSPRVVYHGEIRDKQTLLELLRGCDILLCPSWSEGMPNVILEAMSNGLTVAATDVGATSLLVNGRTGWLMADPRPATIRKTMEDALHSDSSVITARKDAALRHIQGFTWEKVIQVLLRIPLSESH